MARDQPVTDAEIEDAREAITEQREEICEDLEAAGVDVSNWGDDAATAPDPDREPVDSD